MNKNEKLKIEHKPILSLEQLNSFDINQLKQFNDKSVDMIFEDKIECGLDILKKIEGFLETNAIEDKSNLDKKITMIILHNIACCFQKLKDYKNCIAYLEAVIYHFDSTLENKHNITINSDYFHRMITLDQINHDKMGDIILELRFSAKFHLQMCAVLSQAGDHSKALSQAKLACLMCEDNIVKTFFLYKQIMQHNTNRERDKDYPKFEEKINQSQSIIKALYDKITTMRIEQENKANDNNKHYTNYSLYRNKEIAQYKSNEQLKESIRKMYCNIMQKDDWVQLLNLGTIMYLSAFTYDDLDLDSDSKYELLRDAILEKIVMLTVSYFCIATEMRLLKLSNPNYNGAFWLQKAIEYSCEFLPVSCPIIRHYITSYDKFYNSSLLPIPENQLSNCHIGLYKSSIDQQKDPMIFLSCTKAIIHKPKKVISKIPNEFDIINNKFIASLTKLKDDQVPKFKLNLLNIKKNSCENIYKSYHSDRMTTSKQNTDLIKINKIFKNNGPIYNSNTHTNLTKKNSDLFARNSLSSRDKRKEIPSQTHRQFKVHKKDLLIHTSNSAKAKITTSRIFTNTLEADLIKGRKSVKAKSNANAHINVNVNINVNPITMISPVNHIYTYSKPIIKNSGQSLIDKLLSSKNTKIKSTNISTANSTNTSLSSLLHPFLLPRKTKENY